MLKITSGMLRGLRLHAPTGDQTRPTGERVRQAIFNVLRNHLTFEDETVLDLFSGSGALGVEALSNGASSVVFVESHRNALVALDSNIAAMQHSFKSQNLSLPKTEIIKRSVDEAYPLLPKAQLILCDPPYEKGWFEKILQLEDQCDRLDPGGILVFEAATEEKIPERTAVAAQKLEHLNAKIYGDSAVHFFVKR
jgi:16S rRNA (guanine966-N2)-methyltransferase